MLIDLVRNSDSFKDFSESVKRGDLNHAYVFIGQDKAVRDKFAVLTALQIYCRNNLCYECSECEKVLSSSHPDVKYYNLDGKMKVKDAETLIEDTYIRGWESERKLYFIDNADTLTPQVQNKLLKIYEEPPKGVSIILLANTEGGLLNTILSRAKKVYVPVFDTQAIFKELSEEGYSRREAETASVFSGGRFDRAYSYSENEGYTELYSRAFEILKGCSSSADVATYINDEAFGKDNIGITLEFLEIILRDVLEKKSGGSAPLTTINHDYDLDVIGNGFTAGGAASAILAVAEGRQMLSFYVSVTSVAEKILFGILEAKFKCR